MQNHGKRHGSVVSQVMKVYTHSSHFLGSCILQPLCWESWPCLLWKTGTWCKLWEKVPMESKSEPLFYLIFYYVCVCARERACVLPRCGAHPCGGQRTTCWNLFS